MSDLSFREWLYAEELEDMELPSSDPVADASASSLIPVRRRTGVRRPRSSETEPVASAQPFTMKPWPSLIRPSPVGRSSAEPIIGPTRWERPGGGVYNPPKRKSAFSGKEPGAYRRASKKAGHYEADPAHNDILEQILGFTPASGKAWTKEIGDFLFFKFKNFKDKNEVNQKINTAINDFVVRYNDPNFGRRFADDEGNRSFSSFKDRIEAAETVSEKTNVVKFALRKIISQLFAIDARETGKMHRAGQQQKVLGRRIGTPVQQISMDDLQSYVGTPDYDNMLRQMDPATGGRRVARDWMSNRYAGDKVAKVLKGDPTKAVKLMSQILGRETTPEEIDQMRKDLESQGFSLPQRIFDLAGQATPEAQAFMRDARDYISQELMDELHRKQTTRSRGPQTGAGAKIQQAAIEMLDDFIAGKDITNTIKDKYPEITNPSRVLDAIRSATRKVVDEYGTEEQKRMFQAYTSRIERGRLQAKSNKTSSKKES
jgi:hypothetical protein